MGSQQRSVYLGDQKLPIPVPRVRDHKKNLEIGLRAYDQLQQPRRQDEGVLRRILVGLSCRHYEACAEGLIDDLWPLYPGQPPELERTDGATAGGL